MAVPGNHVEVSRLPVLDGIGLADDGLAELPDGIVGIFQLIIPAPGLVVHAAEALNALAVFVVVGGNHAAFAAGGDVLERMETEGTGIADGARHPALIGGTGRMSAVL